MVEYPQVIKKMKKIILIIIGLFVINMLNPIMASYNTMDEIIDQSQTAEYKNTNHYDIR